MTATSVAPWRTMRSAPSASSLFLQTRMSGILGSSPLEHRLRPAEERVGAVVEAQVVLRGRGGVRDARHHDELLVRVRQLEEEIDQIFVGRDTVVLAAQDDGRDLDLLRVADRQVLAHVDVGGRKSTR